jgi:F-type H+-transporting ATPase subunit delta
VAERATIARPYAKAAFEYARAAHSLKRWSAALGAAAAVVADPRVRALTKNPSWTTGALADFISGAAGGAVGDQLDTGMQNFVRVLAENHRLGLLPEISAHFAALRAAAENTADVEVTSAVPLDAAQTDKLTMALELRLKRQVRMQTRVDSALLGGAVIRAGDLVIDGSLKGRLERLGTELGT